MDLDMYTDMGTARDVYVSKDEKYVVKKSKQRVGDIQSKVEALVYKTELEEKSELLSVLCPCELTEEGLKMNFLSTESIDNYLGTLSCDYGITIYDFLDFAKISNIDVGTTKQYISDCIEKLVTKHDLYREDIEDIYAWGISESGTLQLYDYGLTEKDFEIYYYGNIGMTKESFEIS